MGTKSSFNPRLERLAKESKRLEELVRDSDHVLIQPLEVRPGHPPEKYKVTFLCRGITGIEASGAPVYGDRHEVEMYCHEGFPHEPPQLRWNTPIWHPNIQHAEPKNVCVNKPEWLGGMGLDDLCHLMFEMVQYKNYHALNIPPYPYDSDAAKWVLEYAEPRNIVDKQRGISVDDQPFYRPSLMGRIKIKTSHVEDDLPLTSKVKILSSGVKKGVEADNQVALEVSAKPLRIKIKSPGGRP
jgi:ubiquitin-protein ligase